MVGVAVRNVDYADCILVTHFKLFLLKGEKLHICIPCDKLLTIEHIFTDGVDLQECRNCIFNSCALKLFRECCSVSVFRTTL